MPRSHPTLRGESTSNLPGSRSGRRSRFSGPRRRPQYVRKALWAGPGGPRPVLLPSTDQLTNPPIFRIADTDLHTGLKQRRNSQVSPAGSGSDLMEAGFETFWWRASQFFCSRQNTLNFPRSQIWIAAGWHPLDGSATRQTWQLLFASFH